MDINTEHLIQSWCLRSKLSYQNTSLDMNNEQHDTEYDGEVTYLAEVKQTVAVQMVGCIPIFKSAREL